MIIKFGNITINTAHVTNTLYANGEFTLWFDVQEGSIGYAYNGAGEWNQSKMVIGADEGAELFNEYWNQRAVTYTIPAPAQVAK